MSNSNKKQYSDLPLVPESVLKKRHDLEQLAKKRKALQEVEGSAGGKKKQQSKGKSKAFYVIKPESLLARARCRRNHEIRFRRVGQKGMQKRASNRPVLSTKTTEENNCEDAVVMKYQSNSVGTSLVLAIRIRDGGAETPHSIQSTLGRLKLKNIHDGVFVNYDNTTRKLLHLVEDYVIYGPPTSAVIRDLLERRGYAKIKNERVPLSDNTVVEQALGEECGILCVEDMVQELAQGKGSHVDKILNFLYPFKLADSKSHFERRTLKLKNGKEYGDRGDEINDYIKLVL
jgi:large subunit ribosomal protein L7e